MSELLLTEISPGQFSLQGELNRHTIPKFNGLKSVQQSDADITLNMAAVSHVDTAGLAWLINVLKDTRRRNVPVQLKDVPQTLLNLAKISDVDSFLSVQ